MITSPRVYIADLAEYNNGRLHGAWVDAEDLDEETIRDILKPGHEEWAIHDHDGFCGLDISEHPDLGDVAHHAAMINRHGAAWAAYANNVGQDQADEGAFVDSYAGHHDTVEEWAEGLISDCGWAGVYPIPDTLLPYLDMDLIVRKLMMDYWDEPAPGGGVYIFLSQ